MVQLLLIPYPDESGLIYNIIGVLLRDSINIIRNGEFVERAGNHFFMRTEVAGTFDPEALRAYFSTALPFYAFMGLRESINQENGLLT